MSRSQRSLASLLRRAVALALIVCLALGAFAPTLQAGQDVAGGPVPTAEAQPQDSENFFLRVFRNIFNSQELLNILADRRFTVAAFVVLNLIVFVETGLLIGFFLPGDSLLVVAGMAAQLGEWPVVLLLVTLSTAAVIGDSVGYSIGFQTGPKIFNREKSLFFNKDHLLKAKAFYERHGGKTIVLARFMPIIRTFAPVVAGVGRMKYRNFLLFNVAGGVGWVVSMVLLGYYLTRSIDPLFQSLLGDEQFTVRKHIEKVVIIVVLLSISPGIIVWLKSKLRGAPAARPAEMQAVE